MHRDKKKVISCQKLVGGENKEKLRNEVLLWSNEYVLELDRDGGSTTW